MGNYKSSRYNPDLDRMDMAGIGFEIPYHAIWIPTQDPFDKPTIACKKGYIDLAGKKLIVEKGAILRDYKIRGIIELFNLDLITGNLDIRVCYFDTCDQYAYQVPKGPILDSIYRWLLPSDIEIIQQNIPT